MPIETEIRAERKVLIRKAVGELVPGEVSAAVDEYFEAYAGMNIVWDFSRGTAELFTNQDGKEIVDQIRKRIDETGLRYKVAFVAPSDLDFGLVKIYSGFARDLPVEIQIFRDAEEAIEWASVRPSE